MGRSKRQGVASRRVPLKETRKIIRKKKTPLADTRIFLQSSSRLWGSPSVFTERKHARMCVCV